MSLPPPYRRRNRRIRGLTLPEDRRELQLPVVLYRPQLRMRDLNGLCAARSPDEPAAHTTEFSADRPRLHVIRCGIKHFKEMFPAPTNIQSYFRQGVSRAEVMEKRRAENRAVEASNNLPQLQIVGGGVDYFKKQFPLRSCTDECQTDAGAEIVRKLRA